MFRIVRRGSFVFVPPRRDPHRYTNPAADPGIARDIPKHQGCAPPSILPCTVRIQRRLRPKLRVAVDVRIECTAHAVISVAFLREIGKHFAVLCHTRIGTTTSPDHPLRPRGFVCRGARCLRHASFGLFLEVLPQRTMSVVNNTFVPSRRQHICREGTRLRFRLGRTQPLRSENTVVVRRAPNTDVHEDPRRFG